MVALAHALSRLVGTLLLALISAAGLAAAIFCIEGGDDTLSIPRLASYIHLPTLRRAVGTELRTLEAHGPVAWVSLGCGVGAIALGIVLLTGVLVPVRERLVILTRDDAGETAARRRALAAVAAALASEPRTVLRARAWARPTRHSPGGRVQIRAEHLGTADRDQVTHAVNDSLRELADSLPLEVSVHVRAGGGAA